MSIKKSPSVVGGAMIAAGTMIGAGMLSLPIASAGMWFGGVPRQLTEFQQF